MNEVTYLISAEATFEAAHRHLEGRLHGHHWTVLAWITTDIAGYTPGWGDGLHDDLSSVVVELDQRDLADMIPGGAPSPLVVANWIFERLASRVDGLCEVRVGDGRIMGSKVVG
jgi:6-pyruvoyl-tetrahydropterin synthase